MFLCFHLSLFAYCKAGFCLWPKSILTKVLRMQITRTYHKMLLYQLSHICNDAMTIMFSGVIGLSQERYSEVALIRGSDRQNAEHSWKISCESETLSANSSAECKFNTDSLVLILYNPSKSTWDSQTRFIIWHSSYWKSSQQRNHPPNLNTLNKSDSFA
jgi:hypothetical protein